MNRETWLQSAIDEMDKVFFMENGYELPNQLGVSCGFPRARANAIGQCWNPASAKDKTTHMFICPSLDDPISVLATLLHEMIHASVGTEVGHKGIFRKLVKEFGLAGKMTATFAEVGSPLEQTLLDMSARLGEYPHSGMFKNAARSGPKKEVWVRLVSPVDSDYKVAILPSVMDTMGAPVDPWGNDMERCK